MRAGWVLASAMALAPIGIVSSIPGNPTFCDRVRLGKAVARRRRKCGAVTVFENRSSHSGRTLGIHFMVIRADRQPAREALFMFAGGLASIATYGTAAWPGRFGRRRRSCSSINAVPVDRTR